MAEPLAFTPYRGWVNVEDDNNPPPGARPILADDLLRYENFADSAKAKVNEHAVLLAGLEFRYMELTNDGFVVPGGNVASSSGVLAVDAAKTQGASFVTTSSIAGEVTLAAGWYEATAVITTTASPGNAQARLLAAGVAVGSDWTSGYSLDLVPKSRVFYATAGSKLSVFIKATTEQTFATRLSIQKVR